MYHYCCSSFIRSYSIHGIGVYHRLGVTHTPVIGVVTCIIVPTLLFCTANFVASRLLLNTSNPIMIVEVYY